MTTIRDRVQIDIALQTIFASQRNFRTIGLFDNDLIPTDVRYISVASDSYSDTVGTSGALYDAASKYFDPPAQTPVPIAADLFFGRLILSASSPFWTSGDAETDYTVYKLVSDGSYAVTDGTNTDDLTAHDFTSCNSWGDVVDVLNAKLAALVAPTVVGLDTAEWSLDVLGRLTLTNSTTGAAAAEITVEAVSPASGTDLASATYFDAANGAAHPGFDVETPLESYTELKQIQSDFWCVLPRGGTDDQLIELAQQIQTEPRVCVLFEDSSTASNPASSTDLASRAAALGRTAPVFAYVDDEQDFSMIGGAIGADEGSCAFGFVDRALPTDSGQAIYNYALTSSQMSALEDKNYNWMETVSGFKNVFPGRTANGDELRLVLGRDWMQDQMAARIYTARIQRRILGFDTASLAVYETEITAVLEEALARNIIQDYQVTIPDADSFSPAEKATHNVEILEAFDATAVADGWKYKIAGRLTYNAIQRLSAA